MTAAPASSQFVALGTTALIAVNEPAALAPARAILERELTAVDRACSRFRSDSELTRVNRSRGQTVEVGPLFAAALRVALRAAELTDGDVDPTVGRALRLAGYDRDFAGVPRHGPQISIPAAPAGDWRAVELDDDRRTVRVPAGVELDLGATAKAFAADRAAAAVSEAVGAGVLISLGGDVALGGAPPTGGWVIGIGDDHADVDAVAETVCLACGGLATSSTTVRRWSRGGRELHHVIDPGTGLPAVSPWRTVTVSAACCVDANTASTAALVRGGRAAAWLQGLGLPARLVGRDGGVVRVGGWPEPEPQAD